MTRILYIAGSLIAAFVLAVLIVPSFVDWTEYRDTFEQRLEIVTGREVSIDGAVAMTVLPRPALSIEGVRIGSVAGAANQDFLAADSIGVNLAVAPLLSGRVQFSSIELNRPVIFAEVLSDGHATWDFGSGQLDESSSGADVQGGAGLGIDSLTIARGTVRYRNAKTDASYDIDGITAEINASNLSGPFEVQAQAVMFGTSWDLIASVGAFNANRPSGLSLKLEAPDESIAAAFSGQIDTSGDALLLSGRGDLKAERLAALLRAGGISPAVDDTAPWSSKALSASGKLAVSSTGAFAEELEISLDDSKATGTGSFDWSPESRFSIALEVGRADIDSWIEGRASPLIRHANTLPALTIAPAYAQGQTDAGFSLPVEVSGTFDLTADLLEWRGQVLRNARFAATLAGGELTVSDFGIDLPGNTSVAANGFIRAEQGVPMIDLGARVNSRNFRGLLAWWDIEPPADVIPPGRLNVLSVNGGVTGTPERLAVSGISATLDSTTLSGSAAYESGALARLSLDLTVGSLDLDSYLPALIGDGADIGVSPQASAGTDEQSTVADRAPFSGLTVSAKIGVQALTAAGYVIQDVALEASASESDVQIKRLAVADLAGLSFEAAGSVNNVLGSPQLDRFRIQARTEDAARVARAFEIEMPRLPIFASALSVDATVSGDQSAADVEASVTAGDLVADVAGTVSAATPSFDGRVTLAHPDYAQFTRGLGLSYPESVESPGRVAATATLQVQPDALSIRTANANAGENALAAVLTSRAVGSEISMTGQVMVQNADLDVLFPPDPTEALRQSSTSRRVRADAQVSDRWTADPFPTSMFEGVSATIDLSADVLKGRGVYIEQLEAPVAIADGELTVDGWTAKIFGGAGKGDLRLVSGADLGIAAFIDLKEADLSRTQFSTRAGSAASGLLTLQAALSGRGTSQRALISTLEGRGVVAARGVDAGGANSSGLVGGLVAPVRALSQLGGLLSGGVTKGLANMQASFAGEQGMFALSDATVTSNLYSGDFEGFVDVARWQIDVDGRVRLEANLITQLLGNRIRMPSLVPVKISGPLNSPNVRTETAPATAESQAQPQPTQPSPDPALPQQPAEPNPVDLFRGILNELAKPK